MCSTKGSSALILTDFTFDIPEYVPLWSTDCKIYGHILLLFSTKMLLCLLQWEWNFSEIRFCSCIYSIFIIIPLQSMKTYIYKVNVHVFIFLNTSEYLCLTHNSLKIISRPEIIFIRIPVVCTFSLCKHIHFITVLYS